jgi:O-antigen/teichoic acid export membrane protein
MKGISATDIARHVGYGLPLLFTFSVGYLSDWGDHLLLKAFSSVASVGLFGLAYQVFTTLLAANGMLVMVFLPRLIARQIRSGDTMVTYVDHVVPTVFTLWALGAIWVVAFIPTLLHPLAGSSFRYVLTPALVLCAVIPSSVVTSLYTVLFNLQQRMSRLFVYAVVMTVINLGLSFVLIPTYGIAGSAIATAVSFIFGQIAYVADQHQHLRLPGLRIWAIGSASLAAGVIQVALGQALAARTLWAVVSSAALIWTARRVVAVDPALLARILSGPLAPVASVFTRALVTPVP